MGENERKEAHHFLYTTCFISAAFITKHHESYWMMFSAPYQTHTYYPLIFSSTPAACY